MQFDRRGAILTVENTGSDLTNITHLYYYSHMTTG